MKTGLLRLAVFSASFFPYRLVASEGSVLNFYQQISDSLGLESEYSVLLASLLVLLISLLLGFSFKAQASRAVASGKLSPEGRVNLFFFIESIAGFLDNLAKEQCGHEYRKFLPLLAGLFFFILLANLSGLIPGFPPPTENFSANLAMGIIVFFAYNLAGIGEHGVSYIKQFMGPFLFLAPLFIFLEFISHAVRPLSLAFRLLANIFADHLLLSVFSSMVPLLVPTVLLFFGLLVACIQSFVFTMLTSIYINMAISHDH